MPALQAFLLLVNEAEGVRGLEVPALVVRPHPAPSPAEGEIFTAPALSGNQAVLSAEQRERGVEVISPEFRKLPVTDVSD